MKLYDLKSLQRTEIQICCYKILLTDKLLVILCVAKLLPVGYGIKKLQIGCVVEDDKVSMFPCSSVCWCCLNQFLTWILLCAIRWALTSWRSTSQPSRITFSRWTSLLSTKSENNKCHVNKSTSTTHMSLVLF